ncbi:CoA-binding protein [Ramlibacter rhizophilus]|uniref:CoA-binding protein n=1 Tax=Ramlibacter rhizophilus TaxID=1781167 RepID=UPI001F0F4EC0|nr:CoA-binding protein [Ramlibacter rhizophilus]
MNASPPDASPGLGALLSPRSIAVVGASTQPHKVGGMPIRLLRENGYAGAVYPVHRSADRIQGLRAFPSVDAIGAPVDLGVVAVPQAECEAALAQLVRAGARAAVVFTSGFAEVSPEGARLQDRLAAMAREAGLALLGPNCLGAMNLHEHVFATFSPVVLGGAPPAGPVGLVSQSGAFGGYAFSLARERGVGIGHWITTGNEAGVQVADAIAWLAREPACQSILAYLEGARDLERLRAALLAARAAGKPVTLAKVGHTQAGRRAARLHTGSDTGDAREYRELFDACGVRTVSTIAGLFGEAAPYAPIAPAALGQAVAIFSISGGVGIMMADRAEELGLALPPLPADAAERLTHAIPFASTVNPIDVTGQVFSQPEVLVRALRDAATCGRYDRVAVFLAAAGQAPGVWPLLQDCIAQLRTDAGAARLVLSGILSAGQREWLQAQGCPVFAEPTQAIEAAATR